MRTRDFSFGGAIFEGYNDLPPPPALLDVLRRYATQFKDDQWASDASSVGVIAYWVTPDAAAEHIDTLATRVENVLRDIAALPAADQ